MKQLCERLAHELMEMEHMIQQSQPFLDQLAQPQNPSYKAAFVGALALNLHSFYTGAERIFEAIAQQMDQYQPTGSQWHRQLLDQMVVKIPEIRPAVISDKTHLLLDELRRFRHAAVFMLINLIRIVSANWQSEYLPIFLALLKKLMLFAKP